MSDRYIPPIHTLLTDAERERLILLIEECGEVIQAATKTLRWGYDDTHPVTGEVNREMIRRELCDLLTILLLIRRAGDLHLDPLPVQEKIVKLRRYTLHQPADLLGSIVSVDPESDGEAPWIEIKCLDCHAVIGYREPRAKLAPSMRVVCATCHAAEM